jgi:membrane protease YdiL (CAAX protease family)
MDYRFKAILIVICIFIISVFVFAGIYYTYNKNSPQTFERSFIYSIYLSVNIQSLVGADQPDKIIKQGMQVWISIQCFISYLLGIGIVFVIMKILHKSDKLNSIEFKKYISDISKELDEIKSMIKKSK